MLPCYATGEETTISFAKDVANAIKQKLSQTPCICSLCDQLQACVLSRAGLTHRRPAGHHHAPKHF